MKNQKGQSIVETALLLPLLLMLLVGLLDLGRAYYVIVALRDAADEGATYASIAPTDVDGVRARAVEALGPLVSVNPNDISVETPQIVAGQPVTVTVHYNYQFYIPLADPFMPEGGLVLQGASAHAIANSY